MLKNRAGGHEANAIGLSDWQSARPFLTDNKNPCHVIRKIIVLFLITFLISCASKSVIKENNEVQTMKLTSPAFENNGKIPSIYTCEGKDINPPLLISDAPKGTKSFVLIMDDPDAVKPAGKIWIHWVMWNIPPDTTEIAEGVEPHGIPGRGTSDILGYQGPCPPDAEHRYFFKLYALDAMLDLPVGYTKEQVEKAMDGQVIESTELVGRYEKMK